MKPGLVEGHISTFKVEVTPDMFAQFEGKVVHPVYSTVSMVYHMEWASRQIILPFLEEHEEGMGAAVNVKHIAPSPQGSKLTVTATLDRLLDNIVMTKVSIHNEKGVIGVGEVKQVILPKNQIEQAIKG
ncbi:thioesterase [Cytobacillus suaedae]|nr:thioesterase [Cytobacillus suaedae]